MEASALTTIGLPVALGFIMLGLGLHLTVGDFRRIVQQPKPIVLGLACQMLLLPLICFFIAKYMTLNPVLAVGMMLLAVSPGGTTANLYSYLFKGDVALNITLTAINSVLAIVTIPLVVNFSLMYFMGTEQYIPLQFKKVLEIIAIVLIPVALGMVINRQFPNFARRMDKIVKIASAGILILLIVLILYKERANLTGYIASTGVAVLVFNVVSMLVGYFTSRLFNINERQSIAISMEVGIHNTTLAIYLALNVLMNSAMSIPGAVYGVLMFFTAAGFGWLMNRALGARLN